MLCCGFGDAYRCYEENESNPHRVIEHLKDSS